MNAIEQPVDFAGLIGEFIGRVPGVTHALILSADGFPLAGSESVSSDHAEQLAAIAAVHPDLVLFLFGTPGQPRFWFLWDDLCRGALGAIILVDTRRIQDSFAAINYFENDSDIPFIVAVNVFDAELGYELGEIREALTLGPDVPLTTCDARDPGSTAKALQELVSHTLSCTVSYGPDVTWGYREPRGQHEEG